MEQELKEFNEKVAQLFGDHIEEARAELDYWAKKILEIKTAILSGSANVDELKKTESYAWAAISSLYAKHANKIEKNAWEIAERALRMLRNVLLMP